MIKMQEHIKEKMHQENQLNKTFFLKDIPDDIPKKAKQGFIFSFEDWGMECDRTKLEHLPNAQYALIDELFEDYVQSIEKNGEWTAQELNNFQEVNECFHDYLRELEFYCLKNQSIKTLDELIPKLQEVSYFPPTLIMEDGKIIDF